MAAGYYDAEFQPWVQGMRRIGTTLAAQPALAANAQQREATAGLTQARTVEAGAQTRHADQQTADLVRKGQLVDALQQSAQQAQQDYAAGITDSPSIRQFIGASSALTGLNRDDIAANMKQGIGTALARQGKVDQAAAVENPNAAFKTTADNASRENIADKRGLTLGPGYMNVANDGTVTRNPSAASQREGEYEETTTDYPASIGTPASPGRPARSGIFGFGARAAIPPTEGTPDQPARHVKTRRRLGDVLTPPSATATTTPPSAPPDTTYEDAGVEAGNTATGPSAIIPAPREPAQRKAGMVYATPKGNLKWTGTGWITP